MSGVQLPIDLENFFRYSLELLCVADAQAYFVKLNEAWTECLGWSLDELMAKPFFDFVHQDDLAATYEIADRLKSGERTQKFTNRYICKDGTYRWLQWSSRSEAGYFYAAARDITDIKVNKIFFDQMQETALIGSWRMNLKDQSLLWSEQVYKIFDHPSHATLDLSRSLGYFSAADRVKVLNAVEACIAGGKLDFTLPIHSGSGQQKWIHSMGHRRLDAHGNVVEVYGIVQDVSEGFRRKQQLLASEEHARQISDHLKAVIQNLPGMVYQFEMDPQGRMSFPFVSDKGIEVFGTEPEELADAPDLFLHLCHDDYKEDLINKIRLSAETMQKFTWSGVIIARDQTHKWVHVESMPKKLANGNIQWDGYLADQSEQYALAQRAESLAALVESSTDVFAYFDPDSDACYVNQAGPELLGWKKDALTPKEMVGTETWEWYQREIFAQVGKGALNQWEGECQWTHALSGEKIPVWHKVFPVYDQNRRHLFFACVIADLRQRKKDEAMLLQASKMSALGEMAAGIAHEINNPLAVIQLALRKLRRQFKDPSKSSQIKGSFEIAESTVERITKIIGGLKSFARSDYGDEMIEIDMADVIENVMSFCTDRLQKLDIKIKVDLPSQRPSIRGRPVQLGQVLLNLLNNSIDAIDGLSERWITIEVQCSDPKRQLDVRVIDSGPLVSEKVRQQMMDPFFTTKAVGKGTGLGLSIAKGIVETHAGDFYYQQHDQHNSFVISLPIVRRA